MAIAWFEACGSANCMYHAARLHRSAGRREQAHRWYLRAANAGHARARDVIEEVGYELAGESLHKDEL